MDKKEIVATYAYWAIRLTENSCPANLESAVKILDIRLRYYVFNPENIKEMLYTSIKDIGPARNWDLSINELIEKMVETLNAI
jgi:hypothetical protein